jgi:hypothetical protein
MADKKNRLLFLYAERIYNKMKNPFKVNSLKGFKPFCAFLCFPVAEKEGLPAMLVIPLGNASNEKLSIRFAHSDFCLSSALTQASLVRPSENKNPHLCGEVFYSAEKEGFEPPDPWLQINGFQDRRIRPLCHFSNL